MKPTTQIAIAVVIVAVFIVLFAMFMGWIPGLEAILSGEDDNPESPENVDAEGQFINLYLSDMEHHQAISLLANSSPPFAQHQVFINGLHMTSYGGDGTTAYAVLTAYEDEYADNGFTSYTSGVDRGVGRTTFTEVWYNDEGMGKGIIVSDGSAVVNAFGYDVVLTTSYGPIIDFIDYMTFLGSY